MRVVQEASELGPLLDEAQAEADARSATRRFPRKIHSARQAHRSAECSATSTATCCTCTNAIVRCSAVTRKSSRSRRAWARRSRAPGACLAAARIAKEISYDNAGTVEFLYDLDRSEWFFIEMNPRIQVEHTVTEVITGIDLVRAQILIAQGTRCSRPKSAAVAGQVRARLRDQCRVTTEDPENKFTPTTARFSTYRSAGGFGVRLDGGMGLRGRRHHAILRFVAGEDYGVRADILDCVATNGPRAA
jgi:pyruvate carboxylase